jgi:hypothetical protein
LPALINNTDRLPTAVAVARGVDWAALRRATGNSLLDVVAGNKMEEMQAASLPPQPSQLQAQPGAVGVTAAAVDAPLPKHDDVPTLVAWLLMQTRRFIGTAVVDDEPGVFALTPWQQLGFDSLSMTDFVQSCNSAFQLGRDWALADTSMFDHPSPVKLAAVLLDSVKGSVRDREAQAQQAAAAAMAGPPSAEAAGDMAASAARGAGAEPLAAIVGMALRSPGPRSNFTPAGFWVFLHAVRAGRAFVFFLPWATLRP